MSRFWLLPLFLVLCTSAQAAEKARVVTSLSYLAEVARAVGGEHVEVEALAPPGEDPHYISTSPRQTSLLRAADVFVENGVGLEPWTKKVLESSRNPKIQPGQAGHVFAASGVRTLDRPTAEQMEAGGHVHSGGNPHVWLDPLNLKQIAKNVEAALAKARPEQADAFAANRKAFEKTVDGLLYGDKLATLLGARTLDKLHHGGRLVSFLESKKYKGKPMLQFAGGLLQRSLALRGKPLFTYHATWRYFEVSFGLKVVGTVEEKPGIPASPAHLSKLQSTAQSSGARVVAAAPYYPLSRAEALSQRIGGKAIVLPTQPGEAGAPTSLFGLYEEIFNRLESAMSQTK